MAQKPLSDEQCEEALAAFERHGTETAAAIELGLSRGTFQNRLRSARARSAGLALSGLSTLRNADGEPVMEWEKYTADKERLEELRRAACEAMCATIERIKPVAPPSTAIAHLLTLYSFFDYHVGMLAWRKEGGEDWDLTIAERTGTDAMSMLVSGAPPSDTAVVNIGGDFLHFDGLLPITPTHGHVLDADSRFGKVVDVSIRLIRQLVALALQKHGRVILLIMEGNHDLSSSLWLRKMFACLYEAEPRVSVHESELPYYALEWGVNLLGFHHGHLKKNDQLPALFAAKFREMWGRCPKVHIHTGHRHHKEEKDHAGARVTQHPTLAAMDAHAARAGYFTDREITAITYSKVAGQVASNTVTPEMLAA